MSERSTRRSRRTMPNYLPLVEALGRALSPGTVARVRIAHDGDCAYWDNLPCDCDPDVRLSRYEPPMPGRN